jgi:hypothetical protein
MRHRCIRVVIRQTRVRIDVALVNTQRLLLRAWITELPVEPILILLSEWFVATISREVAQRLRGRVRQISGSDFFCGIGASGSRFVKNLSDGALGDGPRSLHDAELNTRC